ncbi:hypothetical protein [Winogradskyella sp.]|uniref:hypothetical protein n=1 Tax=Winogradskyella sp. TaxID=1883156 RepID=UPI00262D5508|nr:hypothetical protein [Winogradskyella sp.]
MNNLKSIVLLSIVFLSCQTRTEFPNVSNQIDFAYKQLKYIDKVSEKNLRGVRYFSNDSLLIEVIGHEYRYKLIYDSNNKLTEEYDCRMYNCDVGYRKLFFYDKNNNFIGNFYTLETEVDKDTISFKQTKFYNSNNQLIKELIQSGKNAKGEYFETWKVYDYVNNRINKEIETHNSDTIWVGNYFYDKKNNLSQITRRFGDKYEIELFFYSTSNQIKEHRIMSNEYQIEKSTSYSTNNNSTQYLYYDNGLIKEKVHYNHLGEEHWKYIYEYESKTD